MPDPQIADQFEQAKAQFLAGLARFQAGDFAQAERHYLDSLALLPGRASTLINLAATQLRLARPADALASADRALAVEAGSADALLHRGTALAQLGRAPEALAAFERLLAIEPAQPQAWSLRGGLLREMGRHAEAAQAFRAALRHGADPELHAWYLASVVTDAAPPTTSPAGYVQELFDDYAGSFERHVVGTLHYQAHERLVGGLADAQRDGSGAKGAARFKSALDLGCGTGLCGPLLRPLTGQLTGVDLSAGMLQQARAGGAYDRLEQADIVQWLAACDERFDLVVAADVFIYVGDLAPVFAAVARVMERGLFGFSVEAATGPGPDFRLLPSLRYAHAEPYLMRLAAAHGFAPVRRFNATVREEQRLAIDGLFVILRRVAEPAMATRD